MKRQAIKRIAKVLGFLVILVILFFVGENVAGATNEEEAKSFFQEPGFGVTTEALNLRNNAGKKIAMIPKGQEVFIKGICYNDFKRVWICWNGIKGTVLSNCIDKIVMYGITTSELNQRDLDGNVLQCIPKGEIVIIKGQIDDQERVSVEWNSHEGSVLNEYIDRNFIFINIEKQELTLYKDAKEILQSPTVTGTYGTSRETPTGVFSIYAMSTKTTLRGPGYASYVEYWMPFYGGYGIHDADGWRSNYGGEIYKTNGSHGCVNMPREYAKILYENAYVGMNVKIE